MSHDFSLLAIVRTTGESWTWESVWGRLGAGWRWGWLATRLAGPLTTLESPWWGAGGMTGAGWWASPANEGREGHTTF